MLFGRILSDRFNSVCRMLQSDKNKTTKGKPFQPTQSVNGEFGCISLLEGRDTPRAVRTWMYSPKQQHRDSTQPMAAASVPGDLHIYMDALAATSSEKLFAAMSKERQAAIPLQQIGELNTHRIQILKASCFLNAKGFYDYELIFWQDLALVLVQGSPLAQQRHAETLAIKLTDILAHRCLDIPHPLGLKREEWEAIMAKLMVPVHAKQKSLAGSMI